MSRPDECGQTMQLMHATDENSRARAARYREVRG